MLLNFKDKTSLLITIIFIMLGIIGGIFNIYKYSDLALPDPSVHYSNSLAIASGQIIPFFINDYNSTNKKPLVHVDGRFASILQCSQNQTVTSALTKNTLSDNNRHTCEITKINNTNSNLVEIAVHPQYMIINWLPQAIGLKIGMISNLLPIRSIEMGRFFNLFVYIILFGISISIIPKGKVLLAFLGLLPSSLFLASSYSADALNISWVALFVAYIFKLYFDNTELNNKQIIIVGILGLVLFFLKTAYIPVVILIYCFNKKTLSFKRQTGLLLSILVIGIPAYLIWSHFASIISISPLIVDYIAHKKWLMTHSFYSLLIILWNAVSFTPKRLLFLDMGTFSWWNYVLIVFMNVVLIQKYPKVENGYCFLKIYKRQLLCSFAFISSICLTNFALLLTWTPDRSFPFIEGYQERYLLELLPLLIGFLNLESGKTNSSH